MSQQADMTPEKSFFAVFCIEALADELHMTGDEVYKILTDDSDILDAYIVPHYDVLHTQGRPWLMQDLTDRMKEKGVLK
jgi:hypothetical protein